jgi:two-component sensor histidine kinase
MKPSFRTPIVATFFSTALQKNRAWLVVWGMAGLIFSSCSSGKKKDTGEATVPPAYQTDTAAVMDLVRKANSYNQTDFDSMRYFATQAMNMAKAIPFPVGVAKARAIEANYQRRKGNYSDAIAIGLDVIRLYDSLHLYEEIVKVKNLVADFYKEMGGEKGTGEYQRKGLELSKEGQVIAERINYQAGIITSLNQQGIILRDMSQSLDNRGDLLDSAFLLYEKAIDIIKNTGQGEDQLGKLYNNISQVYNERYKDYLKALDYQMKAVAFNSSRNFRSSLTYNYNTIAEIYYNMGELDQANEYAHKMLVLSKQLKSPFRQVNAYSELTNINRRMKRYDSALYYFGQRVNLADSINNLEKSNQIADVQTKYETVKKEEEISYLGGLNKAKTQRVWIFAASSGLLLLLLSVVWLQKRRSQQQKQKISQQSEKLQWMMKELHHRVKNNLQIVSSLLNLQSYRLKDEESVSAIRESQLRVQAMSLMHQRLYQVDDVSMVNFKLYLTDLAETLMRAYGYAPDNFDLYINIDKEMLDVDTVMPMGLLVNEIITNSFKYAYNNVTRPSLTITMHSSDKQLKLEISDNGPGMVDADISKEGFGKKLIQALTKQLKATCTISAKQGTVYTLTIPYQEEKAA